MIFKIIFLEKLIKEILLIFSLFNNKLFCIIAFLASISATEYKVISLQMNIPNTSYFYVLLACGTLLKMLTMFTHAN